MEPTRRGVLLSFAVSAAAVSAQFPGDQQPSRPRFPSDNTSDDKLPNGKSQKDAIARENHKKALNDAGELLKQVQQLQDELEKAGDYVVPVNSLKRTEDIEKLARKIRSRLKG